MYLCMIIRHHNVVAMGYSLQAIDHQDHQVICIISSVELVIELDFIE